jgi:hypothetical protein
VSDFIKTLCAKSYEHCGEMTKTDTKKVRTENKWLTHVKRYRETHPGVSYKDVLKAAGASYSRRLTPTKKEPGERIANPWMEHISAWKLANPEWKASYIYKDVLKLCKETYTKRVEAVGDESLKSL